MQVVFSSCWRGMPLPSHMQHSARTFLVIHCSISKIASLILTSISSGVTAKEYGTSLKHTKGICAPEGSFSPSTSSNKTFHTVGPRDPRLNPGFICRYKKKRSKILFRLDSTDKALSAVFADDLVIELSPHAGTSQNIQKDVSSNGKLRQMRELSRRSLLSSATGSTLLTLSKHTFSTQITFYHGPCQVIR